MRQGNLCLVLSHFSDGQVVSESSSSDYLLSGDPITLDMSSPSLVRRASFLPLRRNALCWATLTVN
jgi:hypothetical protein